MDEREARIREEHRATQQHTEGWKYACKQMAGGLDRAAKLLDKEGLHDVAEFVRVLRSLGHELMFGLKKRDRERFMTAAKKAALKE